LHASPPSSSSWSQSVASSLPPSSSVASIITPASRKRTIGEIDESFVHNDDEDYHSRLQLYIPVSFVPDVSLSNLTGSTRQSSSSSSSSDEGDDGDQSHEDDDSNQKDRDSGKGDLTFEYISQVHEHLYVFIYVFFLN
jgi:hypothetical protein